MGNRTSSRSSSTQNSSQNCIMATSTIFLAFLSIYLINSIPSTSLN